MKHDRIITAFPTYEGGPGWTNTPVWVVVSDDTGKLSIECIQPSDQSKEIKQLFSVCAAAHKALVEAVKRGHK